MAVYKTRGIILKRRNFFEADRIITVLTKYHGKLIILAKGVRKTLSKNAGAIELFALSDFTLAEGRNFNILTSAEIVKSFRAIRSDLKKMALIYQIAELTDKILEENQEHLSLYNLCLRVLGYLDRAKISANNLVFEYYIFRSLSLVGFAPQIKTCVGCGVRLNEKEKIFFSAESGGILCQNCSQSDKIILEIEPNQVKLLRLFLDKDIAVLGKIKIKKEDILAIKKIANYYLEYVIEKELKSSKFTERINGVGKEN